ncbi:MAG TPA: glycosyltransferase family A protein [archaeon]|nr:glycosyltransferase family A protein [archaeon]
MNIGLVIMAYNRKLFTEQCIKSVLWSKPKDVSVVIIDDNSTDGTQEMLAEYQNETIIKQIIKNDKGRHNTGYIVNKGWQILSEYCDVLGAMANDMFVEPGWDRNIVACMEELNLDYIIGIVRPQKEKLKKVTPSGAGNYITPCELGASTLIQTKYFLKGFRYPEHPLGKGNIGPMPGFLQKLKRGIAGHDPLKGATLASPGFLARQPEYNNPEYIEYYNEIFGVRTMVAELARRRELEANGNASKISFEYAHSLNWEGFLGKYYPEKKNAEY